MAEFNIGNPIPWEPLDREQLPIPGGEVLGNIEQAIPFPSQPDPEILEELESHPFEHGPRERGRAMSDSSLHQARITRAGTI